MAGHVGGRYRRRLTVAFVLTATFLIVESLPGRCPDRWRWSRTPGTWPPTSSPSVQASSRRASRHTEGHDGTPQLAAQWRRCSPPLAVLMMLGAASSSSSKRSGASGRTRHRHDDDARGRCGRPRGQPRHPGPAAFGRGRQPERQGCVPRGSATRPPVSLVAAARSRLTGSPAWTSSSPSASERSSSSAQSDLGRQVLAVLAQHVPEGMDFATIEADLSALPGVDDVHDLHIWTYVRHERRHGSPGRCQDADTHAVLDAQLASHCEIDTASPTPPCRSNPTPTRAVKKWAGDGPAMRTGSCHVLSRRSRRPLAMARPLMPTPGQHSTGSRPTSSISRSATASGTSTSSSLRPPCIPMIFDSSGSRRVATIARPAVLTAMTSPIRGRPRLPRPARTSRRRRPRLDDHARPSAPAPAKRRARRRQRWAGIHVARSRVPGEKSDAVLQRRLDIGVHAAFGTDVDHAVIGGHEESTIGRQRRPPVGRQDDPHAPAGRTMRRTSSHGATRRVQIGVVDVHEGPACRGQGRCGCGDRSPMDRHRPTWCHAGWRASDRISPTPLTTRR